jgi:hypothetical protein
MRGWSTTKGVLGSCSNPRMRPYWAQYIAHQAKIWQDQTLIDSVRLIVSMFPME